MASDAAIRLPVLPVAWRLAVALTAAVVAAWLLSTTHYYATILVLAMLMLGLVFGAARLLLQGQSAADGIAANRAITRLQEGQKAAARRQDHLQALLDTVSAALLVLEKDGRIAAANRAGRLLARGDGPRLADLQAIGAAAQEIIALAPGARAVLRLADGQQMLAAVGHFEGGGDAQRLISLQAVVGELGAVQLAAWQDMTRVLAHEIMNSLTPIASLSESLSTLVPDGEAAEAAETIARRSQGLIGFVDHYRRLAELPRPRRTLFSARDFVTELDCLMRGTLSGIAYRSEVEDGLQLDADPGLLSQAMINLLNNAVDAVSGMDDAAITLICRRQGACIVLEVADNGMGVPPERAEDIFVPFFTTKPKGSGIGLSLARQILLAHGGRIEVAPNATRGAIFRANIPSGM